MRQPVFFLFSSSDIRSIGVAQAASTISAAIGTWLLSNYVDFTKDIALAEAQQQLVPQLLRDVAQVNYVGWLFFWGLALLAFFWQGSELRRIKAEHGEPTWWSRAWEWWARWRKKTQAKSRTSGEVSGED